MVQDGELDAFPEPPRFSNFVTRSADVEVTRRHMPHWQLDGGLYFVTWRLADSLPQDLLRQWFEERRVWLEKHPKPWDSETLAIYQREFPQRMQDWLDAGYGSCVLHNPACAESVAQVLRKFDGDRYDIASFVVMPNHVHALFQLWGETKLVPLLQAWKGTSARDINRLTGRRGTLWQQESRDTSIRNLEHFARSYHYILDNPRKAGLRDGEYLYYDSPDLQDQLGPWCGEPDEKIHP
ncbi:MAG: transposase [Candidatus Hydrogenedentes bacterium]|nr:transposase [Candidatus Hydrogenedentota bacterium]